MGIEMIDKNPYIPVEDEKTYKKVLEILTNYEDGEKKFCLKLLQSKQALTWNTTASITH